MVTVKLHHPNGRVQTLCVDSGTRLIDVLEPGAVDTPCGGVGRCGKCLVKTHGGLSEPEDTEIRLLEDRLTHGFRLACRATVIGDAEVFLPNESSVQSIQEDGIMPAFPLDPLFSDFGAAVDIGTTTLVGRLYNQNGILLACASSPNPQRVFGADVISRIEKSLAGECQVLACLVRDAIDRLLCSMAESSGIMPERIDTVVLTGNTTMLYLLTARNPACLSRAPFEADELFGREALPDELSFPAAPKARLFFARCISAFVGADITTALLASQICERPEKALMADIGTNGEIALWDGKTLRCCSTAAGPVFEGAEISQGMQGRPGAVDHVTRKDSKVSCHVIGGGKAVGLCGSGVIDAVAVLCDLEIIDESGYMEESPYHLTPEVSLSAKDIRMVQLAKSAVCAGIRTLLDSSAMEVDHLQRLAIAGGFGSFLNLHSAARISLFPPELENRADVLGNAALSGASMILLNKACLEHSAELANQAETVDLTTSPVFTEYYIDGMEF